MEHVASRHIGLSVSSGQVRYALHRLWNPRTEKGLLATLRKGAAVKLVAELLHEADGFFAGVETACEALQQAAKKRSFGGGEATAARRREWTELRIRQPELVPDNVTLPIQRLREAVSELIKLSEDKEIGQELMEVQPAAGGVARGRGHLPQPERGGLRLLGRANGPRAKGPGAECRARLTWPNTCAAASSAATPRLS